MEDLGWYRERDVSGLAAGADVDGARALVVKTRNTDG
jgi:hypothetical protein